MDLYYVTSSFTISFLAAAVAAVQVVRNMTGPFFSVQQIRHPLSKEPT